MQELIDFLEKLEKEKIYYRLNKVRDSIMVEIAVPGERWEVEFFPDGDVQVERFIGTGEIKGASELAVFFEQFFTLRH